MYLSVLIPWRTDNGPREAAWNYLLPLWRDTGAEICIGEDDPEGPFNFARAANRAYRKASHDKLAIFGADQLPDLDVLIAATGYLTAYPWLALFGQTGYYSEDGTRRILAGADPHREPLDYTLPFCTGVLGLTREAFEATGGMDERFSGWGYEDAAFRQVLAGLYGLTSALPHTLRCLWHETGHRNARSPNEVLMRDYIPLIEPVSTRAYLDKRGSFL